MRPIDMLLAALALGGATLLLVRSFTGKRRGCASCHGGCGCQSDGPDRPVELGRPPARSEKAESRFRRGVPAPRRG